MRQKPSLEDGSSPGDPSPEPSEPAWLRDLARLPERAPESLPPASFVPGERVGRFELLREIGRGGFGVVFEARDLQLGRRVAIKAMRLSSLEAAEAKWATRFASEAQAVARLNHPNIVTLYDHGVHRGIPFLVLELLEGETLQQRISRGQLTAAEALDVAVQVARALLHAHAAGIIHRDLKPSNVFLGQDGRVSVLDFGLARVSKTVQATKGAPDAELLSSLPSAGTRAYMSPEQWRGEAEDERTDVFAVGVLLRVALGGSPQPPNPLLEVIQKATAIARSDRYASSQQLFDALAVVQRRQRGERQPHPRRRRLGLLAACLVASIAGLVGSRFHSGTKLPSPPAASRRRTIAVLGFTDLTHGPETAWISTALAEMLNAELAAGGHLRTIDGENVARLKTEFALDEKSNDTKALVLLGDRLGADYIVSGSYLILAPGSGGPGRIQVDLRLQETHSGSTLASITDVGPEDELVELARRTSAALRAKLSLSAPTAVQDQQARASLPANANAARLYAQGIVRLRAFDYGPARDLLEEAIAAEPGNPMTHEALADLLWTLGSEKAARTEAKLALDLSEQGSPLERLLIEGRYWETAGEPAKAAEIYQRLFAEYPDEAEYGFRLLRAQWHAGDASAMRRTLEALQRDGPGVRQDPRIFESKARLALARGDRAGALAAAQALTARGRAQGVVALVFEGMMFEGVEFWNRGDYPATLRSFHGALQVAIRTSDRNAADGAILTIGLVLVDQGRLAEAEKTLTAIDTRDGEARGASAGKLDALGWVALRKGNLAAARSMAKAALEASRSAEGRKYQSARATLLLGSVAQAAGNYREARQLAEEALAVFRNLDWAGDAAYTLSLLGATLSAQRDFAGARATIEEALAIWQGRGSLVEAARCRLALAQVALDEQRFGDAGSLAGEALKFFDFAGLGDDSALARAVLAESQASQGLFAEARRGLGQVSREPGGALRTQSERLDIRLRIALARAFVEQDPSAAQAALAEAKRAGLAEAASRARLLAAALDRDHRSATPIRAASAKR